MADKLWVGLSRLGESQEIPKLQSGEHDWDKFEATLKQHRTSPYFTTPIERHDIEIAAESTSSSKVKYQDLIKAMDVAVKVKFYDVGLTDPAGLAARPPI
jgi:hypothetical protein